jgi:K+-sensing histidine kinase KdpD
MTTPALFNMNVIVFSTMVITPEYEYITYQGAKNLTKTTFPAVAVPKSVIVSDATSAVAASNRATKENATISFISPFVDLIVGK